MQAGVTLGASFEATRCFYPRLTVEENLQYFVNLRQKRRLQGELQQLLEGLNLQEHRNTQAVLLSRGNQQKLSLAIAFSGSPDLVLLDEPTLGLDFEATESLMGWLHQQTRRGTGILLATHDMEFAGRVSGKLAVLQGGKKVAEGSTAQVLSQFQQKTYRIQLGQPLDPQTLHFLRPHLQGQEGNQILKVDPRTFPEVIRLLQNHSIQELTLEKNSITQFFAETLQRGSHALA